MKISILVAIIFFIFIINAHPQTLRYSGIDLTSEAKPSSNVILRKTNVHRLTEQKLKPPAANLCFHLTGRAAPVQVEIRRSNHDGKTTIF